MLAAFYTRTGPAREVLDVGEIETPEAGPGEVRVRLATSGVNPSDVKTRGGVRSRDLPFPRIVPHSDGAGVIDQVGDGVPPGRLGERVWVWNAAWGRPSGTAAQFVVLPAQQAVPLPANTSFEAGACLGIPALTAYHAIHCNGGVAGKTVLVAGGAGAVGHYAIQFAKIAGASCVIATVSGTAKAALARDAGADVDRQLPDRRRRAALPRPDRRHRRRSHRRTRPRGQPEDRPGRAAARRRDHGVRQRPAGDPGAVLSGDPEERAPAVLHRLQPVGRGPEVRAGGRHRPAEPGPPEAQHRRTPAAGAHRRGPRAGRRAAGHSATSSSTWHDDGRRYAAPRARIAGHRAVAVRRHLAVVRRQCAAARPASGSSRSATRPWRPSRRPCSWASSPARWCSRC